MAGKWVFAISFNSIHRGGGQYDTLDFVSITFFALTEPPPCSGTFSFYPLDVFWPNFSSIGGVFIFLGVFVGRGMPKNRPKMTKLDKICSKTLKTAPNRLKLHKTSNLVVFHRFRNWVFSAILKIFDFLPGHARARPIRGLRD